MICLAMLLFGRMWILRLCLWKTLGSFKWGLMNYPSRYREDFVTKDDLNCGNLALEISEEKNVCDQETTLVIF